MRTDRTAYAVGIVAVALAGVGLWAAYGQVNWSLAGLLAPIALILIGAGLLLLPRHRH